MKVIIAYDGSTYADAAIDDLPRAGLQRDSSVLVMTVADSSASISAVSEFDLISAASRRVDSALAQTKSHQAREFKDVGRKSMMAAQRLREQFPEWKIRSEVLLGNPVDELLRKTETWNADLIICGSQGRSAIGRFFLGSVSRSVAERSTSSVRIVRRGTDKTNNAPIEVILGAKDPTEAEKLVKAVGRRVWPADTRVRLVAIDDGVSVGRVSAFYSDGKAIYQSIVEPLKDILVNISVQIESGNPKAVLLAAAEERQADAIFVVGGSSPNNDGLDETAAGLATGAKCTTEFVR